MCLEEQPPYCTHLHSVPHRGGMFMQHLSFSSLPLQLMDFKGDGPPGFPQCSKWQMPENSRSELQNAGKSPLSRNPIPEPQWPKGRIQQQTYNITVVELVLLQPSKHWWCQQGVWRRKEAQSDLQCGWWFFFLSPQSCFLHIILSVHGLPDSHGRLGDLYTQGPSSVAQPNAALVFMMHFICLSAAFLFCHMCQR